ncbi:hypothetical protein EC545_00465 [Helicobacter pylori]|uniref:hypothetical protein n=1 Tax=Helicobacter pylori TaxID=210 RepID=UPI0002BBD9E2|nr:hypothetical protein [Helicobacter pylori]EMH61834.1 hypothetical protein HMPREF1448_01414 [Helicobacter pylori HP260AFi]EMH65421.1 hypothetical protein HMPREF1450_01587 [Helicobacter pylori HP260ASii]MUU65538.1 hypothetical protein [Helicobacter pylori]RVZ38873.1 hypothetical protein EC545_00465 [Helicobacter pylori]RVZ77340.1 hypothetical protein EC593_03735 [Helicobacter pylori]
MKRILFFLVATTFLLRAETASATINTTVDPNVMFSESSTGNVKKDRKRVLKSMVDLEKERVKNFNQYSETKMSKGDLSAFGAFFKGSLEDCVEQKICYYEHRNGKVSFVVNDREKFYKHVLKDLGTELSLPLFNWLYKGSDFGALHEQFGDMYDGYIKYLISMVRVSQKEKARKVDAIVLKKMEEQAEKDTKAAFQKRSSGELESHTDSPEFISSSKTQNSSNPDLDPMTNANTLKETASKEPETSSKKEKKPKKKRRLSKKEKQQQALQQEFEKQVSGSSESEK